MVYPVGAGFWEKGSVSCPKMVGAMCGSSTSAGGMRCTCVTSGQRFWKCSGATSSSCSRPPLQGPGFCLGCYGTWWHWCMETCWVRRPRGWFQEETYSLITENNVWITDSHNFQSHFSKGLFSPIKTRINLNCFAQFFEWKMNLCILEWNKLTCIILL